MEASGEIFNECFDDVLAIVIHNNVPYIYGPSGTGKGTITKLIADELGLINIDTGAMYRCIALEALEKGINSVDKKQELIDIAIRNKEVTNFVSPVSAIIEIREIMVKLQRKMSEGKNVIMEGRDITTVVFPNADVKIYLDADEEERARRRYEENMLKGIETTFAETLESIKKRDYNDRTKKVGALKIAEDAIVIDTTKMSIEEVKNKVKEIIEEKMESKE